MADKYLKADEVAEILQVHAKTLNRWRLAGEGPPWIRMGDKLIRYEERAVREWVDRQSGAESPRG